MASVKETSKEGEVSTSMLVRHVDEKCLCKTCATLPDEKKWVGRFVEITINRKEAPPVRVHYMKSDSEGNIKCPQIVKHRIGCGLWAFNGDGYPIDSLKTGYLTTYTPSDKQKEYNFYIGHPLEIEIFKPHKDGFDIDVEKVCKVYDERYAKGPSGPPSADDE